MTSHRFHLFVVLTAVTAVAGCGGTSATGGASSEPAAAARSDRGMIQFTHCMRQHGIAMRDPFHRPGHDGLSIELPERGPAATDAYNACGHYLQATIELKERATQQQVTPLVRLALIHYAECMRGHAISMLDPGPMGELSLGNVPGISNDLGRYTPQFRNADHACRHLLPATVRDDGTGP